MMQLENLHCGCKRF